MGIDVTSILALINNLGVVIAKREFRVLSTEINKFIDWSLRIDLGENILFANEGTSSYGVLSRWND